MSRSGLGNYDDDYYLPQYRDYGQGDPRAKDVVWDPNACPPLESFSPDEQARIKEYMCQLRFLNRKNPFFVQQPAFQEPPFFAKKTVAVAEIVVAPLGPPRAALTIPIEDRQWAMFTCLGVDVDEQILLANRDLLFWMEVNGEIIPFFDDQSGPAAPGVIAQGQTTIMMGSVAQPQSLRECGTAFGVRGPATLIFNVQNFNGAGVTGIVRVLLARYQYWLPEADEFQHGQYQY